VLVSEFLCPADHPRAGVGGDNIQAETGEADRKLASPTRTVEDARVGRQGLNKVTERRDGALGSRLRIG